mmetsp:Transcript_29984/g.87535  ORF Transcript_29984/g.87535 Transcript_29984/m.87535 type:complete len:218 (-) Transcript_29984:2789-3442(-)
MFVDSCSWRRPGMPPFMSRAATLAPMPPGSMSCNNCRGKPSESSSSSSSSSSLSSSSPSSDEGSDISSLREELLLSWSSSSSLSSRRARNALAFGSTFASSSSSLSAPAALPRAPALLCSLSASAGTTTLGDLPAFPRALGRCVVETGEEAGAGKVPIPPVVPLVLLVGVLADLAAVVVVPDGVPASVEGPTEFAGVPVELWAASGPTGCASVPSVP